MARKHLQDQGAQVRQAAGRDLARDPWWDRQRARNVIGRYLVAIVVLALTVAVSPGIDAEYPASIPVAAFFSTLLSALLRPLMIRVALPFGWFGAALIAVFGNFAVMALAFWLSPGIYFGSLWEVFIASWVYSIVMAIVQWLAAAEDDDVFLVQALRHSTRTGTWGSRLSAEEALGREVGSDPAMGVIFVQLDGMPAPVLDWAVRSGNLPTLSKWIRSGAYSWQEWHSSIPSTTPVAQAGLLHGTSHNMPAFRWYEKETGRLLVANHPPDAAEIESRISNGAGLLADNGVSISNLFSGDADTRLLVMSGLGKVRKGLGPSKSYASFFSQPSGFSRAFVRTIGEMIKEVYQGRTQVKRNIEPRVKRGGAFIALRGVTNVLLRDLNTALVIEAMMQGARSIYVDYVDYDEIAHHAGVQRPESLRALEGLDRVLRQLERVVRYAPRPYVFVCVSDHGQSQGATFRQRFGVPLEDVVSDLMGLDADHVASATTSVEDWGPVNTFLGQLQQQASVSSGLTRRAMRKRTDADGSVRLGPSDYDEAKSEHEDAERELVVVGSGNWGGIWFAKHPGKLSVEEIDARWPGLLPGLATHPGVSFLCVNSESAGPVAMGAGGIHRLESDEVDGVDPLAPFDEATRADLLRVSRFDNAPDIYLNSMYDATMDEVAAFEELVGCHGGVGGWQNRAILVHPSQFLIDSELTSDAGRLIGAESVHQQMVQWLEALGHRHQVGERAKDAS